VTMFITLEGRTPCELCGYRIRHLLCATVRVSKRSMRTTGTSLGAYEFYYCPECGTEVSGGETGRRFRLLPDDAAAVAAYRQQRWPVPA